MTYRRMEQILNDRKAKITEKIESTERKLERKG
jgi:hypothetical protein